MGIAHADGDFVLFIFLFTEEDNGGNASLLAMSIIVSGADILRGR
jgi:hypothetical protein